MPHPYADYLSSAVVRSPGTGRKTHQFCSVKFSMVATAWDTTQETVSTWAYSGSALRTA